MTNEQTLSKPPRMATGERNLFGTHIGVAFLNAGAGFYTGFHQAQGQPVSHIPMVATIGGGITLDALIGAYAGAQGGNEIPPGDRVGPVGMGIMGGVAGAFISGSGAAAGYVLGLASGWAYSSFQ